MSIFGCCANDSCPCASDGKHSGKAVLSATYGGRFCCRRSYIHGHQRANKATYVQRATAWNKNNPERRRLIAGRHYVKTEDDKRNYRLQYEYGITLAEYNDLVMSQCGLCAVCGNPETKVQRSRECRLSVHHDHVSGDVLALLCAKCNRGMGLMSDNPELLRRAALVQEGR